MTAWGRRIGFTGSREGMTKVQADKVALIIAQAAEWHHGQCIGSDAQTHAIARDLMVPIVMHPPTCAVLMADCPGAYATRDPRPYLDRNRDIVDETDELVAAPHGPEVNKSGTWATIRYAKGRGRKVTTIWPDGSVTIDGM
ncbi:hypothetical protein V5F77_05190 [Xanthobacter sp. DSM 24535]|uniref:hypothetical protein n=1 Tax=Roseixanthobacter psychrophilus TaxID=3119917 RepID=UPI00372AC004